VLFYLCDAETHYFSELYTHMHCKVFGTITDLQERREIEDIRLWRQSE